MSFLLYAAPSFLFVAICPLTLLLFTFRRIYGPPHRSISVKPTDFYATLFFGVFITLAGVFGLVAESLTDQSSRWWAAAAFAMQTLAVLIAQLAVIQLLTPDYLFGLLSINASINALPSWRIYALILTALVASIVSIISAFVVSPAPSLLSSISTLVSLSLPLPLLFSLVRIVKATQSSVRVTQQATTAATKRNPRCIDLEISATSVRPPTTPRFPRIWEFAFVLQCIVMISVVGEVVEGALGHRAPVIRLLSAMGFITWGGGIMTIHFIIVYEPIHRLPINSASKSERASDPPSEDFMTLKDPFASPTQAGFPLPPSPPRAAPRRKPRRRASEPMQLKRFGSFAALAEDVKERQAGTEEDQHTQFLEELVRHAWFSTGRTDPDSLRNNSHERGGPPPAPTKVEGEVFAAAPGMSGSSTPTIKQEDTDGLEVVTPSILRPHSFRPVTPPRQVHRSPWTSHRRPDSPSILTSLPLSSPSSVASACSLPLSVTTYPATRIEPPSPGSSESGSSFVSPPPTPTPGTSKQYSRRRGLVLTPIRPSAFPYTPDPRRRSVYS